MGAPIFIINSILNTIGKKIINSLIARYGAIKDLTLESDKSLHISLVLEGLNDKPIDIVCDKYTIASDCSSITPLSFKSNMPFLENLLNDFGKRPIEVPEGKVRWALSMIA